jgi:hypothetical protein
VLFSVASVVTPGVLGCTPNGYSGPITNSPVSYSFGVPSNGVITVRVAGLCESYSLRVDGFECPVELGIGRSGSYVRIDWPSHGLGYRLECATNLPATSWINVTNPPVVEDGSFVISNSLVNPRQFYRLVRP